MERAFNRIYEEYSHLVYYVVFKIVKNSEDAKEITNHTFDNFFDNRYKIHSTKAIKYYLVVAAKNLAINHINRQNKLSEFTEDYGESYEARPDEFQAFVGKFGSYINEEELDILVLHFIYGLKFKNIAQMHEVSTNVITSKYHRALEKIREKYTKGD